MCNDFDLQVLPVSREVLCSEPQLQSVEASFQKPLYSGTWYCWSAGWIILWCMEPSALARSVLLSPWTPWESCVTCLSYASRIALYSSFLHSYIYVQNVVIVQHILVAILLAETARKIHLSASTQSLVYLIWHEALLSLCQPSLGTSLKLSTFMEFNLDLVVTLLLPS